MDHALLRGLALCGALGLAACQSAAPAQNLAAPPAPPVQQSAASTLEAAQKVELGAVTCRQALQDSNLLVATLTWADGYAHGRMRQPRTTGREIVDHKPALMADCASNGEQRVVAVVERINRARR